MAGTSPAMTDVEHLFRGVALGMSTSHKQGTEDAPQAIPPDSRPMTHDRSDSRRAASQPYAAESEHYQGERLEKPRSSARDGQRAAKRKDRG
jgi:hypothetical protein